MQAPWIRPNGVLLAAFQYLFVESGGGQRREIGYASLHVISMPVGGKVLALFRGSLKGYAAGYTGEHGGVPTLWWVQRTVKG
jgi:hypothetical protein